jgi:TolB protein
LCNFPDLVVRAVLLALLGFALLAPVAGATPPGANGKIAFSIRGEIHTVEADGSGFRQLVRPDEDAKRDWLPAWSPDGSRLATFGEVLERNVFGDLQWSTGGLQVFGADGSGFTRLDTPRQHFSGQASWSPYGDEIVYASDEFGDSSLYIVGADGSNPRLLVYGPYDQAAWDPAWSPDGQWIAFTREVDDRGDTDLFLIRPDGSGLHRVLERPGQELGPSWSPDGRTLAFTGSDPVVLTGGGTGWYFTGHSIYTVPAAGGTVTRLTQATHDGSPAWSPDGRLIAFQRHVLVPEQTDETRLWLMNADGSDQHVLVEERCLQCDPDWQRVPPFGDPPPPRPTPAPVATPVSPVLERRPTSTRPAVTPIARVWSAKLTRSRFTWRGRRDVKLTLNLSRAADVTIVVKGGRGVTRGLPQGVSRIGLRDLLSRRLKPGTYKLVVRVAGRETRRAFRILR